jgi:hypothetical protein
VHLSVSPRNRAKKRKKLDLKLRGRWFSAKEKPTFLEKTRKRENGKTVIIIVGR